MANVTPSVLTNAIMGKLYDVLTNGDQTVPKSDDNFFTWSTPGIPVDPNDFDFLQQGLSGVVRQGDLAQITQPASGGGQASSGGTATATAVAPQVEVTPELLAQLRAQDTGRLYMQAESLARIVDFVPDVSRMNNEQFARFNVQNNNGTLSEVYEHVLRMSQVMEKQLPADVTAKIEKFRKLLSVTVQKTNLVDDSVTEVQEPSPLVKAYNEKMAAYMAAALEYNNHRIDALSAENSRAVHDWAINANIYREKVKAAMADWISSGYKVDYEQIAAYIDQVTARDMSLLKAQYKDDLLKAKLTGLASGSDFYFTSLAPGGFMKSGGWTRFTFASSDFNSRSKSQYNYDKWSVSASGGFLGIFGGSGGGSGSTSRKEFNSAFDSSSFSLSFEICQVPIIRPWFKSSYLNSKCWRFDQNDPEAKNEVLCDAGKPPKGLMPAYPTTCVFIRNLHMNIGKSEGFKKFVDEHRSSSQNGGGFLNIGPFFLGGGASHSSQSGYSTRDYGYKYDNQGMHVDGPQIIGFKCHVLPKSPNPLATITNWI